VAKKDNEKEKKKTKTEEDEDFQYIVRIANTDIDGNKKLIHGLSSIKGIGRHMSTFLIKKTGLDVNQKMGYLTEKQIETISNAISSIQEEAPSWMLNHRKDYETGEDIHIIGPQIEMRLRDEINIMKKIRSYKGIRNERGLTVRGQRTRTNNRKGLSLGVSRSRGR
jgi:small subunit ribosomal protein S13